MKNFDPQTSVHVDEKTGQVTFGGAARNKRIAAEGGQDKVQQKAYQQGYLEGHADGYKEGFEDGREHGAKQAYESVDARLKNIEKALKLPTN